MQIDTPKSINLSQLSREFAAAIGRDPNQGVAMKAVQGKYVRVLPEDEANVPENIFTQVVEAHVARPDPPEPPSPQELARGRLKALPENAPVTPAVLKDLLLTLGIKEV